MANVSSSLTYEGRIPGNDESAEYFLMFENMQLGYIRIKSATCLEDKIPYLNLTAEPCWTKWAPTK